MTRPRGEEEENGSHGWTRHKPADAVQDGLGRRRRRDISNGLNGFRFSYDIPQDQIQVIVQEYFSANGGMYDDHIWAKYKLGEALNVKEPATGRPATRNLWYKSKIPAAQVTPPLTERGDPYYSDVSIEGLQRRGVLFLIGHQTIHGHTGAAAESKDQNPDNQTPEQIVAEIQAHLIPDGLLIPAAVGELVRIQEKGYRMVVNG